MESSGYPKAIRRVQSASIDGVIIPVAAIVSLIIMSYAGMDNGYVKALIAGIVILVLEPFAVSVTGGTIGHHLVGLRVRRVDHDRNINLLVALIRFVVKVVFGLLAFITMLVNRRRQGIHDLVTRSVVVFKSSERLPDHVMLKELTRDDEHHAYVSIWRRLLVIMIHSCIAFIAWSILIALSVSVECIEQTVCTGMDEYLLVAVTTVFLILTIAITILGWRGLLYGCRKQRISG